MSLALATKPGSSLALAPLASQFSDDWLRAMSDRATTPATEADLLAAYASGHEAAFDQLVERYQESAFWVARHLLFDDEAARDVVQDAFIRLLKNYERFDSNRASFKAWFFQIVRNLAIDELRRRRARPNEPLTPEHHGSQEGQHSRGIEQAETGGRIRHIISLLDEPYRETLLLRDVEGLPAQEVAAITATDYGTTRWRIHEARKRFKLLWEQHVGPADPGAS